MASDPRSIEPIPEQPPVLDPQSTDRPEVAGPDTLVPEGASADVVRPDAVRSDLAEPDGARPDVGASDVAASDVAAPDLAASDLAASDVAGTDAAGTDAVSPSAGTDGNVVAMHDVSHRFEDHDVLTGIDLTVPRGTILGIIGPSGAGKTTTIRILTGAIKPTSGEVRVLGRAPKDFHRHEREQIGYMPQLFTLYEDLTAGENVDFVASLFGMLFRRRRRRVREVLKAVDLWDARGRQAGRLSGGMQRRLELACALVHEPDLIILDEPTAGIDPLLRGSIWEELHALRDAGRTLLVTTQHVSEADECDAVAMIVGGRIIALAPPDELRRIATNGDLLDIETNAMFDGSTLLGTPGVKEVTQDSPRHLRVVVDDAGSLLPVVVERITSSGGDVESAREHRLSFDEIFAILVARTKDEDAATDAAAGSTDGAGETAA